MHIRYSPVVQNLTGELTDRQVYAEELRLADLSKPVGFDWTTEHHFTEYEMNPRSTQSLTGQTIWVCGGSVLSPS